MQIKKLFVIFKTHLDIGYTDMADKVIDRYMESYIPEAIRTARALRESGREARLVWTTGSWLIQEYLRTHEGEKRENLCRAILDGDVCWHGLPFTTHTEMMGAELFRYGLSISGRLDRRFHRKTIGAKMTDVPGHTRAIIPYMREAGVEFLHIGVNPASAVPKVPALFRWRSDTGETINVMYQNDYGEFSRIGDSDMAVYFAHTGDNLGVQSPEEIIRIFDSLKERMPEAKIIAADLNDLALAVRSIEDTLPVVTDEIGDTWIHGIGTDPKKVSWFKALERFWRRMPESDDKDRLARGLLLVPEHTWGLNGQLNLTDQAYFKRSVFEEKRKTDPSFRKMEASWQEQRMFLVNAVEGLSSENREKALACMSESDRSASREDVRNSVRKIEAGEEITFAGYTMRFNRQGEIDFLEKDGRILADRRHRLVSLRYEQFCEDDYKRFYNQYSRIDLEWSREDFTKVGMYRGVDCYRRYEPERAEVFVLPDKIVAAYFFPEEASREFGCPESFDLVITAVENGLCFDLAWFRKPANRIAEAIWAGFHPIASGKRISKLGRLIDPKKVADKGQCRLHGTDYGVVYDDLSIETLDAPLAALQEPSLLNFCNEKPQDEDGIYFHLYNNVWATNFPMWYEEDARFRFLLHLR